jgi:gliding motility-associated-like protein
MEMKLHSSNKWYLLFGSFWQLILGLSLLLSVGNATASHISGGSIKYKYVGLNTSNQPQYYIEASLFRDCSGMTHTDLTASVTATCTATNSTQMLTLPHIPFVAPIPTPYGGPYTGITYTSGSTTLVVEEVSDVCDRVLNPNISPFSKCRTTSSSIQGYVRYFYGGIFTLPACNAWRLSFDPPCCRNSTTNISSGSMHVETIFNNLNFLTNSAPDFADEVKPIPSACVGKPVLYGIGTWDPDGDSLRFELTCAMQPGSSTTPASCVPYSSGYSASVPAPGLKMDSATGMISFTPSTVSRIVVAFWVKEYERCTGILKAQTLRDVQFRNEICNNNIPRDISGMSNISGKNIAQLDTYKLQVCSGTIVSWEDTIYDPDATDTLVFYSNSAQVLPGSQMTVIQLKPTTNQTKAVVRWTWTASIGLNPVKVFFLVFNDDRCDYPGNGFSVFEIEVRNSTTLPPDFSVCMGADTAYIEATGGRRYNWRSIWGDSLIFSGPNRNVWADTTANDTNKRLKFFPSQTTYIEVWSDMIMGCMRASACQARDSIKIIAAKDYNIVKSLDTLICYEDSTIQIEAFPDSATFSYTYSWRDDGTLSDTSITNPFVTPLTSRFYKITIASDSGCVKSDSIRVAVTPPFPKNIQATTTKSPSCAGVVAPIVLSLGNLPTSCGPSTNTCVASVNYRSSTSTTNTNGAGNAGVNNWPCPYGGGQLTARQQFLYRRSELRAMGITAGSINGLGFNVVNTNSVGTFYNYQIRIRCISDSNLTTWRTGTSVVYNASTFTVQSGWNMHNFTTNYNYDGTSHLIVEVCWDNYTSGSTSSNASCAYLPTAWPSCVGYYSSSSGGGCNAQSLSLISTGNRPTIQLSFCGARDSSEFTYQWTPATGLNFDTVKDPVSTTNSTIKYTVSITDTFGKCSDTTSLTIYIATVEAGPDTVTCVNDTIQLFAKATASCTGPGVYVWGPSQYFVNDSVQNPLVSVPRTTQVTVTFYDACGCIIKDSLTIYADSIKPPLIFNTDPSCGGGHDGQIKLRAVGGFGPYTYSIDSGATLVSDSTFKQLVLGEYWVTVRDSNNCPGPVLPDTLFEAGAPRITALNPVHISCKDFSDGEIGILTRGGIPPLSYSVDSGTIWQTGNPVMNLRAGKYKVYVRGSDGCTSYPEYITLTEPDSLLADFRAYRDTCFDTGDGWATVKLKGGTLPYNYTWTGIKSGASHIPVTLGDTVYAKLFAHKNYRLQIRDAQGCIVDTTFEIKENPKLEITENYFVSSTCYDYDNAQIFIRAKGGVKNYVFSIDSGKTYYAPFRLASNDSIRFDTNATSFGKKIPPGIYHLQVKDKHKCTSAIAPLTITEPPLMQLTAAQDSFTICVSTCADLSVQSIGGNNPNHTYHWTPFVGEGSSVMVCPTQNSVYSVYAKDERGCASNGVIIKVSFFDSLKVRVNQDTAICDGSTVQFFAQPSGGDGQGYKYEWLPFKGLSNAFIQNPLLTTRTPGVYRVKLTDNCGSPAAFDSVNIEILPQPVVDFSVDTSQGCPPFDTRFSNHTNASAKCEWHFGDGSRAYTCQNVTKTFNATGIFDVTLVVTSVDGCKDSLTYEKMINIYPVPKAAFDMTPQPTTLLNTNLNFNDRSEGRLVSWYWNFATMDTSTLVNPMFRFPDNKGGKYPVRLDVVNDYGCSDDTVKYVLINEDYYMYVPSSFTPNGDGKNDTWKPVGTGFEGDFYLLLVFDRWGNKLFEATDLSSSWDGTYPATGEFVPVGTYTWRLIVGDKANEKDRHESIGTVTIIR